MVEKREFYDINGNPTGITYYKGDPIPDGYYVMVVMICLQNSDGYFLMQKRSPIKGGNCGVTGGHPKAGETPLQGIITEVREEIGLDIEGMPLKLFAEGRNGKACYKMYYLKMDIDIDSLVLQKEEVSAVRWFSAEELKKLIDNNELIQNHATCIKECFNYLNSGAKE